MIAGQLSQEDLPVLAQDCENVLPILNYETLLEDCKTVFNQYIQKVHGYSQLDAVQLPESDPICKILEVLAYRELMLRQRMHEAVKACYLSTSLQDDLQRLASLIMPDDINDDSMYEASGAMNEQLLRKKIVEGYGKIYTAGSRQAYLGLIEEVVAGSEVLLDTEVSSPSVGIAQVVLLHAPQATDLQRNEVHKNITERLNEESVRPIGQKLEVKDAQIINYHIQASIGIRDRLGAAEILAACRESIGRFIKQQYGFGKQIYRTAVLSALHQPGVDYIILGRLKPNRAGYDVVVGAEQAAWCSEENIDIRLHVDKPRDGVKNASLNVLLKQRSRISCDITIEPAENEIRLTHYVIYWGKRSGEKLPGHNALATVPVGNQRRVVFSNHEIPDGADCYLILTANENGEMEDKPGNAYVLPF